jgi:hypothetical protein
MIRRALAKARARHEASELSRERSSGLNRPLRCFARRDFSVSNAVSLSPRQFDCEPERFQVSVARA